jgi:serine/threonine-protein kinase HipA
MYLHPDGIARRIRWAVGDVGAPDWAQVLDRLCELDAQLQPSGRRKRALLRRLNRAALVDGLRAMAPALQEVAERGETWGLAPEVLRHLRPGILAQAQRLAALV